MRSKTSGNDVKPHAREFGHCIREGADQLHRGEVVDGETCFRDGGEELDALEEQRRREEDD